VSDTAATRSPAITTATLGDGRTIAALATTPGRGALAIIRLSGAEARDIAAALLDPAPTRARHATRCTVRDAQGRVIDDAIATLYVAPHTFTGEDLVEISTHGGVVVPTTVLAAAIAAGARQAEPGEFTRRAVLNGKLDLLQAEAIADLVDARSSASERCASRSCDSRRCSPMTSTFPTKTTAPFRAHGSSTRRMRCSSRWPPCSRRARRVP
jgi:tRNA modification GTPase